MVYNDANLTYSRRFQISGVSALGYGWEYSTGDSVATVQGSGYFNTGAHKLRIGDLVAITANDGNLLVYISDANPGGSPSVNFNELATVSSFSGW